MGEALPVVAFGDERLPARFWAKVRVDPDGCWRWTRSTFHNGYGQCWHEGRNWKAHRLAAVVLLDVDQAVPTVDHECHNRAAHRGECLTWSTCTHRRCVNPAHLAGKTNRENVLASPLTSTAVAFAAAVVA